MGIIDDKDKTKQKQNMKTIFTLFNVITKNKINSSNIEN